MWRPAVLALLACACTAASGVARSEHPLAARLPAAERARIASSTVPVLLPRSLPLSRAALVVERTYTALSVPIPGATVSLHAARIAHRYAGIQADPGPRRLRGVPGRVSVNEGIWTATWVAGPVAYALDLECASATDPRCADEQTLVRLVEELTEVGP